MTHWFKTYQDRLVNLDHLVTMEVKGNDETRVAVVAYLGDKLDVPITLGVLVSDASVARARLIAQHIVLTDCSTWEQAVELAGGDGDDSCTTWDKATDHRTGAA